jgi:hypothetical protein
LLFGFAGLYGAQHNSMFHDQARSLTAIYETRKMG